MNEFSTGSNGVSNDIGSAGVGRSEVIRVWPVILTQRHGPLSFEGLSNDFVPPPEAPTVPSVGKSDKLSKSLIKHASKSRSENV